MVVSIIGKMIEASLQSFEKEIAKRDNNYKYQSKLFLIDIQPNYLVIYFDVFPNHSTSPSHIRCGHS